jgi:hypothetical protein
MLCITKLSLVFPSQAKRNLESSDVIKSHKEAERLAAAVSSRDAELASLREALARERAEKEKLRAQFERAQMVRPLPWSLCMLVDLYTVSTRPARKHGIPPLRVYSYMVPHNWVKNNGKYPA